MATIKQKLALSKLAENGGNFYQAMVDAGYTPITASTPKKLTNSKGWNELMEQYFPDDILADLHRQGLYAVKKDHSMTGPDEWIPDMPTRKQFIELAYRLKGRMKENINQFNVGGDMNLEFRKDDSKTD